MRMEETPSSHPSYTCTPYSTGKGTRPEKEKLREAITLSLIIKSPSPPASPSPDHSSYSPHPPRRSCFCTALWGMQDSSQLGSQFLPTPSPSLKHPPGTGANGTSSPDESHRFVQGCSAESSREGTCTRVHVRERTGPHSGILPPHLSPLPVRGLGDFTV